jgi:hypothetical protein
LSARTGWPVAWVKGQGLVPGGDPEPVQDLPVAGIGGELVGVAFAAQCGDLVQ